MLGYRYALALLNMDLSKNNIYKTWW
jgi:hypothetical protein